MSLLDAWLDERIRPPARVAVSRSVLVLCRTNATVHAVRGWLARRGGLAGIEVATPRALASQLAGPWLEDRPAPVDEHGRSAGGAAELPDTAFTARIRTRPGLVALARARVRELRLNRLAKPDVRAPPWLEELAASGWANDVGDEARLLDLARENGSQLTSSMSWARVVSVGFGVPLDPWTDAVHRALVGPPERAGASLDVKTAYGVPDTASEARLAALEASTAPYDTVILVEHEATAARAHRALLRAGVPSAWRVTSRLERHTLASVIRRCVPWFSGASDPSVRAVDLHAVLRHPMVLGRLPPPAQTWLESRLEAIGEDPTRTALSPRDVARSIRRARHLDAPLSRWIEELQALSARTDEKEHTAPRALRLLARLKVLDACVRGLDYGEVFGVGGPEEEADWGDFDALIADLLGDQDPTALPDAPPAGTLGALRRFLLACRLRTGEDPASLRILGALRRGSDRPATRLEALQLLQGTADKGEIRPGVSILAYDDYDGRPCRTLILLDLHDQGVAARPMPDPLLKDYEIEGLGGMDGRAKVTFRLDQLRRAAHRAERVVAVVSARDAMGRAVVPPVQLGLDVQPAPTGAYGLALEGPESGHLRALRAIDAVNERPSSPDPELTRLAVQATAEWSRSARGPVGAPPVFAKYVDQSSLGHHLVRRPSPPDWLAPWLGDAHEAPEASLGEAERSVTRFFNPLAHCLYQAYARVQLGLKEPESVSDELDPREIGTAAHAALELVALRGAWAHEGEREAVIEAFTHDLRSANKPAFDQARERFGALSPARRLATDGLEARWSEHWSLYARNRARKALDVTDRTAAENLVYSHRWVDAAVDALLQRGRTEGLPELTPMALRYWVKDASEAAQTGESLASDDQLLHPGGRNGLPAAWVNVARSFVDGVEFKRVVSIWATAKDLSRALTAPTVATAAELPFGTSEHVARVGTLQAEEPAAIGPIRVQFGKRDLALTGSIDRVSLVGEAGAALLRVIDYKSGTVAPDDREARDRVRRLVEPQLVVYALVLRQALREGRLTGPFAGSKVASVGWDFLRATDDQRALQPSREVLLDEATLDELARAIGALVQRATDGQWSLSPLPDTCPELGAWRHDHCPFAGACRLRAVPRSSTAEAP